MAAANAAEREIAGWREFVWQQASRGAPQGHQEAARLISGLLVGRVKHGRCSLGASKHVHSAALRHTLCRHGACIPRHLSSPRLALPAARLLLLLVLLLLLCLQVLLLLRLLLLLCVGLVL